MRKSNPWQDPLEPAKCHILRVSVNANPDLPEAGELQEKFQTERAHLLECALAEAEKAVVNIAAAHAAKAGA